jgi:DNA-damage-inducible protein J
MSIGGFYMNQSTISVRLNSEDKKQFEEFCEQTGMNISVAINMFVKNVIREQKLPFEVKADPFYSEENMAALKKSIKQLDSGKGKMHDLIEVDE